MIKKIKKSNSSLFAVMLALCAIAGILTGLWWLFYWLWNTIAADIFGAPELTFWQSVGLMALLSLFANLFRGGKND